MVTVSIVIAMYNIDKYISHCINSCINQNTCNQSEYEILVVNDGSTDNSLKNAQKSLSKCTNGRIISKKNGGLSSARNYGLLNVKGEYVWFVDGDDAISPNAISTLIQNINRTHCNAYIHNFSTFCEKGIQVTSSFNLPMFPFSGKNYHNKNKKLLPLMAWLTVYRTDFLRQHQLIFMEGIISEDTEFAVKAHHMAETICFVSSSLYYYRINRNDSIMYKTSKDNTKSLVSNIAICKSHKTFFANEHTKFTTWLFAVNATAFFSLRYDDSFCLNNITKQLIVQNKYTLYKDMLKSLQLKRFVLLMIIIIMPNAIIKSIFRRLKYRANIM